MTISASLKDQIESLYVGYFGRAADSAGASYWMSQIESGSMTLDKVAASFAVQPEAQGPRPKAQGKYAYLSGATSSSPADFVNQVYHQLFNHDADTAGLQYWRQQLAAAHGNPQAIGQFVLNVISGATGADDAALKGNIDGPRNVTPTVPDTSTTPTSPAATHPSTHVAHTSDIETTAPDTSTTSTYPAATQPLAHVAPASINATAATDGTALSAAGGVTIGALSASGLNTGAAVDSIALSSTRVVNVGAPSSSGLYTNAGTADVIASSAAASINFAVLSISGITTDSGAVVNFIPANTGLLGVISPAGTSIALDGTHAYTFVSYTAPGATVADVINGAAYFFTVYDQTSGTSVVSAAANTTNANLNSVDIVSLTGLATMSAADLAGLHVNLFPVIGS